VALKESAFLQCTAALYSRAKEVALPYDVEFCLPLIFRAALLSNSTSEPSSTFQLSNEFSICSRPPPSCHSILTQTEIIERVLLPHANLALAQADTTQLSFLADTVCQFIETLEKHGVTACTALLCLVTALLWRLGRATKGLALLRSRRQQKDAAYDKFGVLALADMLSMIAIETPLGIGVGTRNDNEPQKLSHHARSLNIIAIDLMCSTSSYHVVAKHFLELNRTVDAITVCTNGLKSEYDKNARGMRESSSPIYAKKGTRGVDFFNSAIATAKNMDGVGERTKLFCHLYTFLSRWDPGSLNLKRAGGVADKEAKSTLVVLKPNFPDELFGGKGSVASLKLREMYGYGKQLIISRSSVNLLTLATT